MTERDQDPASPGPPEDGVPGRVLSEVVAGLFARLPLALATVLVNSLLVAWVLHERLGWPVIAWTAALWAVSAGRLGLTLAYRRSPERATAPERWALRFTAGSALNGLAWGALAALSFGVLGTPERLFVTTVVAGMVAGAAGSAAGYRPAFLAFALPALLPVVARLFLDGGRLERVAALMGCVFAAAMASLSRDGHRALRDALALRFHNEALAEHLSAARERLAATNLALEDRVRERTARLVDTERRLAQSALLAGVGSLAAGVAHDINSPLASVIANLGYAERELAGAAPADPGEVRAALAEAAGGAGRVRDIVRNLAELSRLDAAPGPIDLQQVVEACLQVSAAELAARARPLRDYREAPPVSGDRASLVQVCLGVVLTALRAVPAGDPQRHQLRVALRPEPGTGRVLLEVSSSGAPRPGALEDPGHPLSLCRSIAAGLGGALEAGDDGAGGARFRLWLPAVAAPVSAGV